MSGKGIFPDFFTLILRTACILPLAGPENMKRACPRPETDSGRKSSMAKLAIILGPDSDALRERLRDMNRHAQQLEIGRAHV